MLYTGSSRCHTRAADGGSYTSECRLASAGLDRGFGRLYDLDFTGAQKEFESWEKLNPENPMGPASEAAGILFSEFNRLGRAGGAVLRK